MDSTSEPTSLNLDSYLAPAGSAAASFARLWDSLWVQPYVPAPLLEMCRLTLARLHQNEFELRAVNPRLQAGALAPQRRASVQGGEVFRSTLFSDAEKSVLSFCECYGLDPQSIADAVAEEAKAHLGEPGLVFLIEALGCIDGRMRSARCLRDLGVRAQPEYAHGQ